MAEPKLKLVQSDEDVLAKLRARDSEFAEHRAKLEAAAKDPHRREMEPVPFEAIAKDSELAAVFRKARKTGERVAFVPVETARLTEEQKQAEWQKRLRAAAPIAHLDRVWNARTDEDGVDAVETWLSGAFGNKHLLLSGPSGCGKTLAAAHAVKRWVEPRDGRRKHVSWVDSSGLVSMMLHRHYDDRAPRLGRYVVVDDLGADVRSPSDVMRALEKLFDEPGIRVIITTNLPKIASNGLPSFFDHYNDPRLVSRVKADVEAIWLRGKDLRPKGSCWE